MNKIKLNTLAVAISLTSVIPTTSAIAAVSNYSWNGVFTFLDEAGAPIANTSLPSNDWFATPISGTMAYDDITGAGTATMTPFDWGEQPASLPFEATSFTLQNIGDGVGGSGTLILGNILFNWNGTNGFPVSIVLDAAGFLNGDLNGGGAGATPASDGTYVGTSIVSSGLGPDGFPGYLALGPVPIATTAWDTTSNCSRPGTVTDGACANLVTSGVLPLIYDNAATSGFDYTANTGGNIGGSPMIDGPFSGKNFNLDFTTMTLTSTGSGTIEAFDVGQVPIPSAVWLFGSGLIGLIGLARRKA